MSDHEHQCATHYHALARCDCGQQRVAALEAELSRITKQRDELLNASLAVIDRWHTPSWKDAPATAKYIQQLEHAVAEVRGV